MTQAAVSAVRRDWFAALASLVIESASGEPLQDYAWPRTDRPAIAVAGLSPRCGVTTIARALGAELAVRDADHAAVVTTAALGGGGIPLGTLPAGRLARAVGRSLPVRTRAVGRLCFAELVADDQARLCDVARTFAPLVIDVADASTLSVVASLVDAVLLVGSPASEPALARVLVESLARVGPEPFVVLNREGGDGERWEGHAGPRLPDARVAAQLALAGREAPGEFGRAIAALADHVLEVTLR